MDKKKKSDIEYFILFCISGFASMKCLAVYDSAISGLHESKYLYLGAFLLVLWLFSAAKLNFFNVFRAMRKLPKTIKQVYWIFKNDYINWKLRRGYYARK